MKNKGITLIALVITIIVLLILAGISLSLTLGENGILTKAREARLAHMDAEIEEEMAMAYAGFKIAQKSNQIQEANIYKAQKDYVEEKLVAKYGSNLKEVYKSGKYTKAEFKNNDRVYVLKHDGTVYHYRRMKPTDVYWNLDESGTLYIRRSKADGYAKGVGWHSYGSDKMAKIQKAILEEEIAPTYITFSECVNLEKIEHIENLYTNNMTSMYGIFSSCKKIKEINFDNFDTSKVTNMGSMFNQCQSMKEIDLSGFDTNKVTNMSTMFRECAKITNLDVSEFDTREVENMKYMFSSMGKLEKLDLSNFDTNKVKDMSLMFADWNNSLNYLNLSGLFIINEGTNCDNMFIRNYKKPKIVAKKSTIDVIKEGKGLDFTDANFEIVE